jgi:hypothetical protein
MLSPVVARKIEVIANLSVLMASILLSVVLAKIYLLPKKSETAIESSPRTATANNPVKERLQAGTKVSLPGVDWNKGNRTLLLALSTTCHFCSESAPLYQQILKQRAADTRIVAVLPQSVSDSLSYLTELGVSVDQVIQAPLSSVRVSGTPTLILVDSNAAVVDSWRGKLASIEEEEVLSQIRSPGAE